MKILFFGTPRFAEIVLGKLLESRHQVVGVVCQTDKVAGRYGKMTTPHIVSMAKERGLSVFQFEKLSEHIEDFKNIACDIGVTASYGKIIPKKLLEILPIVNVHPSLLPKYRGGTPIQSALLAGDTETGVTIMKTDVGMDDGDIYASEKVQILPDDDYTSLHDKLADVGANLLLKTLDDIESGKAVMTKQNSAFASYVKLIQKEDALLDFNLPAQTLVNKVRAFCEKPVAYLKVDGHQIKVFKAVALNEKVDAKAGEIVCKKKHFKIATSDGVFEVQKCQGEGGKIMEAAAFLNGWRSDATRVEQ